METHGEIDEKPSKNDTNNTCEFEQPILKEFLLFKFHFQLKYHPFEIMHFLKYCLQF